MADDEIRSKLAQLHDEIENLGQVDEAGTEMLRDIDGHIQELLAKSEHGGVRPQPGFGPGLADAIRHFEVTHPTLTEALSDLLTALSNAGI